MLLAASNLLAPAVVKEELLPLAVHQRLDKDLLFKDLLVNYVGAEILSVKAIASTRCGKRKQSRGELDKKAKKVAKDIERQEDLISGAARF